ncbi:MAG TPA: NAD(P)/FAD-dependent oxidoreductase [Opitutales bacterium]|nr:NAD(P)/FAD-dependent oxidoreductase [Opitutales bacterium]
MNRSPDYDAVVVGSGPNGLTAAIVLQKAGLSVLLIEGKETLGGGARTAELTLPGFHHDICSAIHPLAATSPVFQKMPLEEYGLEWIEPPIALAHPFDDGTAAILEKSLEKTAKNLGADRENYENIFQPIVKNWENLARNILAPFHFPRNPLLLARFGIHGLRSAVGFAKKAFRTEETRALFAGLAAHSLLPLNKSATAAFGLVLGALGHINGWPFPKGGAQKITDALAGYFRSLGGKIETGRPISDLRELPTSRLTLLDITPKQLLEIAGDQLSSRYRRQLSNYRYGPGAFKIDWALSEPVPFSSPDCRRAATLHLGGSLAEIAASESAPERGILSDRPFVLFVQPSLFDPTRAPEGKQTAWAYCHVPHGSTADRTEIIEKQIERFAPGFRDTILARHTMHSMELQEHNPNLVGGDINGGAQSIDQLFTRPVVRLNPYATSLPNVFLCSSSTPPGGGVHGICGYHAAKRALKKL